MTTELLFQVSSRRTTEPHGKVSVRGITLKEYFRLCQEEEEQLNAIQEESVNSSKSSLLQTPSFQQHHPNKDKQKVRTEATDAQDNRLCLLLPHELPHSNRAPQTKNEKAKEQPLPHPQVPQMQTRRRIFTKILSKQAVEGVNRSTMGNFFQVQKQRKMLKKVQADRQKVHEMNLKEALSITKYGTRFNVNFDIK